MPRPNRVPRPTTNGRSPSAGTATLPRQAGGSSAQGIVADGALVSDATRAQETWAGLAAGAGWDVEPDFSAALYAAGPDSAFDLIRETPAAVRDARRARPQPDDGLPRRAHRRRRGRRRRDHRAWSAAASRPRRWRSSTSRRAGPSSPPDRARSGSSTSAARERSLPGRGRVAGRRERVGRGRGRAAPGGRGHERGASSRRSSRAGSPASRWRPCWAGSRSSTDASRWRPGVFVPRRRTELLARTTLAHAAAAPRRGRDVLRRRSGGGDAGGDGGGDPRCRPERVRPGLRGAQRPGRPAAPRRPLRRPAGRAWRDASTCSSRTRPTSPPPGSRRCPRRHATTSRTSPSTEVSTASTCTGAWPGRLRAGWRPGGVLLIETSRHQRALTLGAMRAAGLETSERHRRRGRRLCRGRAQACWSDRLLERGSRRDDADLGVGLPRSPRARCRAGRGSCRGRAR